MAEFTHDPLGYVMYSFPWGVKGTPLEKRTGPRKWQAQFLKELGERLRTTAGADRYDVLREAIVSGHGVGKSALFAFIVLWALSTMEFTRGLVTANTAEQLSDKTWPELEKWHSMSATKHWFETTATAIYHVNPEFQKRWRVDAVTWSEHNTEAFAGLHNEGYRILLMFDEASGIPPRIWEVAEGATTDEQTEIIWCVAGNPTRPIGRFKDCFGRLSHRWHATRVDARGVEGTSARLHEELARDYGIESDYFKVRVLGEFPSASPNQLIPEDWVRRAVLRYDGDGSIPMQILSADVADGGVDLSVITHAEEYHSNLHLRAQTPYNFNASVSPIKLGKQLETDWENCKNERKGSDKIIVDSMGVGAGTAGYLLEKDLPVVAYKGGGKSVDPSKYRNMRVQCYINLRNALRDRKITIDPEVFKDPADLDDFVEQICSIMRVPAGDRIEDIETKEQMLRRGVKSPDRADSVAMLMTTKVPTLRLMSDAPRETLVHVVHSSTLDGLDV